MVPIGQVGFAALVVIVLIGLGVIGCTYIEYMPLLDAPSRMV